MKALLLSLACILLAIFLYACGNETQKNLKFSAPEIDITSTFEHAKEISKIVPRYSGSPGTEKTIAYFQSALDNIGVKYQVDRWTEETPAGKITFSNLIAEIEGKKRDFILVASHHDTKYIETIPGFQGANDGASANAAMLGIIEALKKSPSKPQYSILFAFLDGEECRFYYSDKDGLHGSKRLSAKFAEDKSRKCLAVIVLDMIGDKDLKIAIPSDSDPILAKILFDTAHEKNLDKYFTWHTSPILDDHVPFQELGIPAIDLIDFNYGPSNLYWHSAEDKLENISAENIGIVANVTLGMLIKIQNEGNSILGEKSK